MTEIDLGFVTETQRGHVAALLNLPGEASRNLHGNTQRTVAHRAARVPVNVQQRDVCPSPPHGWLPLCASLPQTPASLSPVTVSFPPKSDSNSLLHLLSCPWLYTGGDGGVSMGTSSGLQGRPSRLRASVSPRPE